MGSKSSIEWTEYTWNPVTGCTKISPGCLNCYAERMAARLSAMGQPRYRNGFEPTLHPEMLALPSRWKKPRRIFVNSMSGLFHESVPIAFIDKVFHAISNAPWHTFQVLTKRTERLRSLSDRLPWPRNLWMGVTVESIRHLPHIDDLRASGACLKFIFFEPLLGSVPAPDLDGIDWEIAGGESGPRARPMAEEWVKDIRDACVAQSVAFFFKQCGGWNKKARGRILGDRIWHEYPGEALAHCS